MKEYDDLLKNVKTFLKESKFSKNSTNFVREGTDFYEVVNFQRDKYSTKDEVLFTINIGVVSKKILDHKNFKFFNNLMHNQWQTRISSLMGKDDIWFTVNQMVDMDALSKQIKHDISNFVFPAFKQYNSELFIVAKLRKLIEASQILPFNTAEDLLILVAKSFPTKIEDTVGLFRSKIKDSNDKMFIAELMRELGISG